MDLKEVVELIPGAAVQGPEPPGENDNLGQQEKGSDLAFWGKYHPKYLTNPCEHMEKGKKSSTYKIRLKDDKRLCGCDFRNAQKG